MTHDLVSELVARLRGNNGGEAESLIRDIEAGAKKYVCPLCGLASEDPFVGLVEEPKSKIVFYCPVCNEHKQPLEIFAFNLEPRLGIVCTGCGLKMELCKQVGCRAEDEKDS
jgi:predicted RNA-binding Zn-ribbon protein involved in translation (DUF1610 family)